MKRVDNLSVYANQNPHPLHLYTSVNDAQRLVNEEQRIAEALQRLQDTAPPATFCWIWKPFPIQARGATLKRVAIPFVCLSYISADETDVHGKDQRDTACLLGHLPFDSGEAYEVAPVTEQYDADWMEDDSNLFEPRLVLRNNVQFDADVPPGTIKEYHGHLVMKHAHELVMAEVARLAISDPENPPFNESNPPHSFAEVVERIRSAENLHAICDEWA